MSNQRSVMTEFRFLDQKRQAEGLTAEEAARYAQLRDLVGPETAGPTRTGFDVNAAAARLRESLLPAGLRGRPPELDAPAPAPPPPPAPPPEVAALEQAWAEAPFADLTAAPDADPLFDPGSLGLEVRPQAWNPDAPGYDPDAPYDEAAWIAAGYDPNATYDWSAAGYAPEDQPQAGEPDQAAAPAADLGEGGEWGAEGLEGESAQPADAAPEPAAAWPAEGEAEPVAVEEPILEDDLDGIAPEIAAAWPAEGEAEPVALEPVLEDDLDGVAPEIAAAWPAEGEAEPVALEPVLQDDLAGPAPEVDLALGLDVPAEGLPGEPEAAPADEPALEAAPLEAALPFDPDAPFDHAKWFGRPAGSLAAAPEPAAALELGFETDPMPALEPASELELEASLEQPMEVELEPLPEPALEATGGPEAGLELEAAPAPELEPAFDATPEVAPELELLDATAATPTFGEYDETAAAFPLPQAALEADPSAAPERALPDLPPEPLAPEEAAAPDQTADWFDDAATATHQPAPAGAAFGDYDEAGAQAAFAPPAEGDVDGLPPFDLAAASALEAGELPEGYDAGGPSLDPALLPPVGTTGYDEIAPFAADDQYGGPEGDSLPGGTPLELEAPVADWQPDAALEHGFELASDGSFGHADLPGARTPAWGTAIPAAPVEGWENTPALDLAASFDGPVPTPTRPLDAWTPADGQAQAQADDLPTIEGAELLEELPAEATLDAAAFEPEPDRLGRPSPLDGAFEDVAAVEAAAYPPPDLEPALVDEAPAAEPAYPEEPLAEPPAAERLPPPLEPVGAVAAPAWEPEPAISYEPPPPHQAELLPPEISAAYGGGGGQGDTFELPPAVADSLFDPVPEPEPLEPEPLPAPAVRIEGTHRVVLHTVDGQVKRGLLIDALLDAAELPLHPQGPGEVEEIPAEAIKAIFFMLTPGEKAPAPVGKKVRVTFRDGRQVAGFSPDYEEGLVGFFMIPADTRTNTGRIWVYQAAVKQVAVS